MSFSLVSSRLSPPAVCFLFFIGLGQPSLMTYLAWVCCQWELSLGNFLICWLMLCYLFGTRDICIVTCHWFTNFDVLVKGTKKTPTEGRDSKKAYWYVISVNVCICVVRVVGERIKPLTKVGRYKAKNTLHVFRSSEGNPVQ